MRGNVPWRGFIGANGRRKRDGFEDHRRNSQNGRKLEGISPEGSQGLDQRRVMMRVTVGWQPIVRMEGLFDIFVVARL